MRSAARRRPTSASARSARCRSPRLRPCASGSRRLLCGPPEFPGGRSMAGQIVVHEKGGPEKLVWETFEPAAPGPGEIRVRHAAIGLNFIDTYLRTGLYPPPAYPF